MYNDPLGDNAEGETHMDQNEDDQAEPEKSGGKQPGAVFGSFAMFAATAYLHFVI